MPLWRADAGELGSARAQHYMATFGVTNRDLAHVSVAQAPARGHQPGGVVLRRLITLEEHQQSRWIVEPVLRLLDCCQESDGGVAPVVTSLERARDLRQPPCACPRSRAVDPRTRSEVISNYYHADLTVMPEANRNRALDLRSARDWRPGTCRSRCSMTRLRLPGSEAARGVPASAVRGGRRISCATATSSSAVRLPVNTNGGLIGEAYIHGMNNIITEAVRQVRGTARQPGAWSERRACARVLRDGGRDTGGRHDPRGNISSRSGRVFDDGARRRARRDRTPSA